MNGHLLHALLLALTLSPGCTQSQPPMDSAASSEDDTGGAGVDDTATEPTYHYSSQAGWKQVVVDADISCGVHGTGEIACWGGPLWEGVLSDIPDLSNATQVALTTNRAACALDGDGFPHCWGRGVDVASVPPDPMASISGGSVFCGVRTEDGGVVCWGDTEDHPELLNASAGQFRDVDVGLSQACAIRLDGALTCWGSPFSDEPGGTHEGHTFDQISVGTIEACGVRSEGGLHCWPWATPSLGATVGHIEVPMGSGYSRYCGIAASDDHLVCDWKFHPPPPGAFVDLSISSWHGCAVTADSHVVCWGDDDWSLGATIPP